FLEQVRRAIRLTPPGSRGRVGHRPLCAIHQEDVAVTFRTRSFLAAVAGLWMAHTPPAPEPAPLNVDRLPAPPSAAALSADQQTANRVAASLEQSGQLRHYRIDVACAAGTVELAGVVADAAQREAALRLVKEMPGVERVVDHLSVGDSRTITQVN